MRGQIYLNKDRKASEALLKKVTDLGAAAVMFTVDAAYRSKRTMDVRAKSVVESPIKTTGKEGESKPKKSKAPLGVSAAISGYQDTNLTWDDIKFIRVSKLLRWCVIRAGRRADLCNVEKHHSPFDRKGYTVRTGCRAVRGSRCGGDHPGKCAKSQQPKTILKKLVS